MKIVIYGLSSFAELMHYYLSDDSRYEVVAFCADKKFIKIDKLKNLPVVSFEEVESIYPPNEYKMLLAVGYSIMRNRKILFDKAKQKGYRLINYIHKSINYENLVYGENNIIFPGTIIEPFTKIGNNNVIWSMAHIAHDSQIGNHNFIAAKCLISGNAKVGDLCFIGNGVNMIDGLKIENESYLVAGSNILKDTKEYGMYIGNPAKILVYHKENGIIIE